MEKERLSLAGMNLFKEIVESSSEAIAVGYSDGRVIYMNPSCEKLFGWSLKDALDLNFYDYCAPESVEMIARDVVPSLVKGKGWQGALEVFDTRGRSFPLRVHVDTFKRQEIEPIYGFALMHDMSDQKQMNENLQTYERIVSATSDLISIIDKNYRYQVVNEAYLTVFRRNYEDIVGRHVSELLGEEAFRTIAKPNLDKCFRGETVKYDRWFETEDGRRKYVSVTFSPYCDTSRTITGAVANIRDMTERKLAEDEIKSSLSEKEVLLQEIHHRVKNNMQVISSLIGIQEEMQTDDQLKTIFQETQSRVRAMALIHEILYESQNLASIDMAEYVRRLATTLIGTYAPPKGIVEVNVNSEDIALRIDRVIPCGLIIHELMINALKYAFQDGRDGDITVEAKTVDEGEVVLIIEDNGIGLPPHVSLENTPTLGLQLVVGLVKNQLRGSITAQNAKGAKFTIRFEK